VELHSRAISPFAARVRVSILAKNLPVRIIESPDVSSDAYAQLNPFRRVPVLVLDDGTALPESEVIVQYLEERYPEVSLLPADAAARARVRLVARAAELYVFPAVVELFTALATGSVTPHPVTALEQNLQRLDALLDPARPSWHVSGAALSSGDAALAPFLLYVEALGPALDCRLLEPCAQLSKFLAGAQREPTLTTVLQEMARALAAARGGAR